MDLWWSRAGGITVVPLSIQRLRRERTILGISIGAGLDKTTYYEWMKVPSKKAAIQAAIVARRQHKKSPQGCPDWVRQPKQVKKNMVAFAQASTMKRSCRRSRISFTELGDFLRMADRLNVSELVRDFINPQEQLADGVIKDWGKSGLIAPGFFVPTDGMLAFRDEAIRAGVANPKVNDSLKALPALEQWFLHLAVPKPHRDRRNLVAMSSTSASPLNARNGSPEAEPANGSYTPDGDKQKKKPNERQLDKGNPGRPDQNTILVEFAASIDQSEGKVQAPEILRRFKKEHPQHPIFKNDNPVRAFRMALYRARLKSRDRASQKSVTL